MGKARIKLALQSEMLTMNCTPELWLYKMKASDGSITGRSSQLFTQQLIPPCTPQHISSLGKHNYLLHLQQVPVQQSSRLKITYTCAQSCSGSG